MNHTSQLIRAGAHSHTSHSRHDTLSISIPSSKGLPPELRLGKMHLVDLAGSERLALSAAEGDTLIETQSINLSLTALGDVLSALSKNANIMAQHKNKAALEPTLKSKKVPLAYFFI